VFPVFLKLAGKRVLVVGAGKMAEEKLPALGAEGAQIDLAPPEHLLRFQHERVRWHQRPFEERDLNGMWYVVSAAPPEINAQVTTLANERQIFVNAVDDLEVATAYLGAVVETNGLTLAISSSGAAPGLVSLLRQGLEELLPEDLSAWLDVASRLRPQWKRDKVPFKERKPQLLRALNRIYEDTE
jgi:siroheme synthase-like protein